MNVTRQQAMAPGEITRLLVERANSGDAEGMAALYEEGFRPDSLGGLYEKIFLGMELLWLALVAVRVTQGSGEASDVTAPCR